MQVTLAPADYYRLRYLQTLAERDSAEAAAVSLRAAMKAQQSQQQFLSALAQAAHTYDFDPSIPYTWDDSSTALVAPELHG